MESFSIYFHIPYCKSKCPYCDFFKKVEKNIDQVGLTEVYIHELEYYKQLLPQRKVRSIFFGGGTPSLIEPKYIEKLIDKAACLWPFDDKIEISLEANPNSNHDQMFSNLKSSGINRISVGVQALNDDDLRFLGRTHTLKDALTSIEEVLKIFNNHSIDLIYARPEQKIKSWLEELKSAASFGLKHLSLYQLTIEEGTVFARRGIKALDERQAADMYQTTVDFLRQCGYPRYEVSNFATKPYQSVHNKVYWQGDDYIGIGQSAHGRLKIDGKHYAYTDPHQAELLSNQERATELVIMGLRLEEGIDKAHFKAVCGLDFDDFVNQKNLKEMIKAGFVLNTPTSIKATDKGFHLLDKIILELCC